jgi:hypothetical protein
MLQAWLEQNAIAEGTQRLTRSTMPAPGVVSQNADSTIDHDQVTAPSAKARAVIDSDEVATPSAATPPTINPASLLDEVPTAPVSLLQSASSTAATLAFPLPNTSNRPVLQAEGSSNSTSHKRPRSDSALVSDDITNPAKAARITTPSDTLKGKLSDPKFCDLVLSLVKHHEAVLTTRNSATSANESSKLELAQREDTIKGMQTRTSELEDENRRLVVERNAATTNSEQNQGRIENQGRIIEALHDMGRTLEEKQAGLVEERDSATKLAKEKESEAEKRYSELEVKRIDTELALATTQHQLKKAKELADKMSESSLQREKDKVGEKKEREREKSAMDTKVQEMKEQIMEMEKGKKAMEMTMKGMQVRLEEVQSLRTKTTSAVQTANSYRQERNEAQAKFAMAQEAERRHKKHSDQDKAALDAAAVTIQKLRDENTRLAQRGSANQVAITPTELASLQASHRQLEAEKTRLETDLKAAKKGIDGYQARLQASEASLVDHNKLEKELVAAKILATNYGEQRDQARTDWKKAEEVRKGYWKTLTLKTAEMSRLHAEIRNLKADKPRVKVGEGDSGSIGEVEGLVG